MNSTFWQVMDPWGELNTLPAVGLLPGYSSRCRATGSLPSYHLKTSVSGAMNSTKNKNKNQLLSHLLRDVNGAKLSYFWAVVKKILPSLKSETNFSLVQFKWATLRRPLIHLNDEELVFGNLSTAGGPQAFSCRDPGNGYPWCFHGEGVIKFLSGSMRFITCPANRNYFWVLKGL